MPIVDGSRLVGILTRRDLVRALAHDDRAIAADIRRRLRTCGGADRWSVEVHDGPLHPPIDGHVGVKPRSCIAM
jgi:hypothetical protein